MSLVKYRVSVEGSEHSELDLNQIVNRLLEKTLSPTDCIFDSENDEWIPIVENEEVMSRFKSAVRNMKSSHNSNKQMSSSDEVQPTDFSSLKDNPMLTEWYILKGENKFGPFQYSEVIKMLQEKIVFEFDFAWQNGMSAWTRIAQIENFRPEHIKKLQGSLMPEIKNVFFRRKHPRIPFECEVVVHDNVNVWSGKAIELSEGGAGLIMENSLILPGQKLYMHFKSGANFPAFNAICEVVSKKYMDGVKKKEVPVCYGVKFTSLSEEAFSHLQKYTKSNHERVSA